MDPRRLHTEFGLDERLAGMGCAYCGAEPDSVDHVPSRILLDNPLPENLPTVPACIKCNRGFSRDEEYFACFLESVICGSPAHGKVKREKVRRALQHSPALAASIASCVSRHADGQLIWEPNRARVEKVLRKLALGHAAFEWSTPCHDYEAQISYMPLMSMSQAEREAYEVGDTGDGWPEIGSRAFLRAVGEKSFDNQIGRWITIQNGRYRYATNSGDSVYFVISEYLACEVSFT